jgi:predicted ATPase
MQEAFVKSVALLPAMDREERVGYPWELPAIAALSAELTLNPGVTYLVGENGSGKSTLLEAIAVAAGMNAEGGSSNFRFSTRDSHSALHGSIRLVRGGRRPRTDFSCAPRVCSRPPPISKSLRNSTAAPSRRTAVVPCTSSRTASRSWR